MRALAYAIGGGWAVRHEGCEVRCCEREAEPVEAGSQIANDIANGLTCEGCDARLDGPPAPMDFDRDAPCELGHEDARGGGAVRD